MTLPLEGVIKFEAEHTTRAIDPELVADVADELLAWRERLHAVGLVGQDPARYEGAGYGNMSARLATGFVITGTQTGAPARIGLGELCIVERWDISRNRVVSHGPVRPSSESMTHGALYDLGPLVAWVFHVHSPAIWRRSVAGELRVPVTDGQVPYGTPEMARAMATVCAAHPAARVMAMGGHEDGVVAFGESADEAGEALLYQLHGLVRSLSES